MIRKIKKQIKNLVDPISKLAFDVMPEGEVYPHCVATIANDYMKEGLHLINLDIDVWDKNTLTDNIDRISEEIEEALNGVCYTEQNLNFVIWHTSSGYIQDNDKSLRRKTCVFEIHARKDK